MKQMKCFNRWEVEEAEFAASTKATHAVGSYCSNLYINVNVRKMMMFTRYEDYVLVRMSENNADGLELINKIENEVVERGGSIEELKGAFEV